MNLREGTTVDSYVDLATTRRSVRSYKSDECPDDVLRTVIKAANNAPSAAGVKPWEFVVIRDEEIKAELSQIYSAETKWKGRIDPTFTLAGNSQEFMKAPVTVLIVGDRRYKQLWPRAADGPIDYREKLFHQSLASSIISLQLAGTAAGLGTTWPSTRGPTQNRLRKLLDLPEWYHVGAAVPLGYPDLEKTPMTKSRKPLDEKIHENSLDPERIPSYEDLMERKEGSRKEVFRPDEEGLSREEKWATEMGAGEVADLAAASRTTERYSVEPVPSELLEDVLTAARWAPSAANSQPWEFIVVRDKERMSDVADAVRADREYKQEADPQYDLDQTLDLVNVPQEAFESAPMFLIVAGNRHIEKLWPQVPDQSREKLFRHSMTACITSMTYAARAAGLGTSWLTPSGFGQQRLRELLDMVDIPSWYYIECVTPLGYPDSDRESVREEMTPEDEKIHWDDFDRDRSPDAEAFVR